MALITLFTNIMCLLLVLRYYKGLKMLKRLTEEVVIPIPYRVVNICFLLILFIIILTLLFGFPKVPFHFRKENMHVGNSGYKHLLSDSNPNYIV